MPDLFNSFLLGYVAIGATMYSLSRLGFARRRRLEPTAVILSQWNCFRICAAWPFSLAFYAYYCVTGYYDRHP